MLKVKVKKVTMPRGPAYLIDDTIFIPKDRFTDSWSAFPTCQGYRPSVCVPARVITPECMPTMVSCFQLAGPNTRVVFGPILYNSQVALFLSFVKFSFLWRRPFPPLAPIASVPLPCDSHGQSASPPQSARRHCQ